MIGGSARSRVRFACFRAEAALWIAETGAPTDLDAVLAALFRMLESLGA